MTYAIASLAVRGSIMSTFCVISSICPSSFKKADKDM